MHTLHNAQLLVSSYYAVLAISVVDPDPVGSGLFLSDPNPDRYVWDRIRILALINYPIETFLCKSHKYLKYLLLNFLVHEYTF
jgi:hypothetical protein